MRFYVIGIEECCPMDVRFIEKRLIKADNLENAKKNAEKHNRSHGMTTYRGIVLGYYDENNNYIYVSLQ